MSGPFIYLPRWLKHFGRARDGVAAVELAITILPLMVMVVAVIEMGRYYQAYHVSDKALRDAARFLAQQDIDCPVGSTTGTLEPKGSFSYEDAAKFIALTGAIDPQYFPGGGGTLPSPPPADELLLADWNNPGSITVTYRCEPKLNGNLFGGEFLGAFATEPAIPVVEMSATVPFTPMIELWPMPAFTVTHSQVGIGDQSPDP